MSRPAERERYSRVENWSASGGAWANAFVGGGVGRVAFGGGVVEWRSIGVMRSENMRPPFGGRATCGNCPVVDPESTHRLPSSIPSGSGLMTPEGVQRK